VHAALPQYTAQQSGAWVVQVAAVENTQDADVLVSALRRRGYSVSARHNAGDNLIHVQVGPFTSRSDADSMRQRLLNDGYNANTEQ
jgi:cell division septation protein DedD